MIAAVSARPCLVVIDERDAGEAPLQAILQCAHDRYDGRVCATLEAAAEAIASAAPAAVLMHAGFDRSPGAIGSGPLFAALSLRRDPALPFLLYTRSPASHALAVAQLGVRAPLVADDRLALTFNSILEDLAGHTAASVALRRAEQSAPEEPRAGLPEGFRIERWRGEVERALILASMRDHRELTSAAAAVGLSSWTLYKRLDRYHLPHRNTEVPFWDSAETLLWCSSSAVPSWVRDACDAARVATRCVPPGTMHPPTMISRAVIATIVEPIDPGSAVDAWLSSRSMRPFVVVGPAPRPIRILLEELRVGSRVAGSVAVARDLIALGRASVRLHGDEDPMVRLRFGPEGCPTWPLDLRRLLGRLDGRIIRLAVEIAGSIAAAARLVGLPEKTCHARLRRAERLA